MMTLILKNILEFDSITNPAIILLATFFLAKEINIKAIPASSSCTPIKRLTPIPVPRLKINTTAANMHKSPAITVTHRKG